VPVFPRLGGAGAGPAARCSRAWARGATVEPDAARGWGSTRRRPLVQSFKTQHLPHVASSPWCASGGARCWTGPRWRADAWARASGHRGPGPSPPARPGGRGCGARARGVPAARETWPPRTACATPRAGPRPAPVHPFAIAAEKRTDEREVDGGPGEAGGEDPALVVDQEADTQVLLLGGQGELHLPRPWRSCAAHARPVAVRPPPVALPGDPAPRGLAPRALQAAVRRTRAVWRRGGGRARWRGARASASTSAIVGGVVPKQ